MSLTQTDLQAIKTIVEDAIDDSDQRTAAGFAEVHEKLTEHDKHFEKIDGRLDKIDGRLDRVEKRLGRVDAGLNRIENKLGATIDRVDDHSAQLKRLQPKAI